MSTLYPSFENLANTHPFKIFYNGQGISIEPSSILYDSYTGTPVKIKNIGKNLSYTKDILNNVYLQCNVAKNVTIISAEIKVSTSLPSDEISIIDNQYKLLTKIIFIGGFYITTIDGITYFTTSNNIVYHLMTILGGASVGYQTIDVGRMYV